MSGCDFEDPDVVCRDLQEDPLIGQVISHYKILEVIGEGGMGVVYEVPKLPASDSQRAEAILRISRFWIPLRSGIHKAEPTLFACPVLSHGVGTQRRI